MEICSMTQGTQTGLCNNLDVWDRVGMGEFQEGEDMGIPTADSC